MSYYDEIKQELIQNETYKRVKDYSKNRNTIESLGILEEIHNPNFNYGEFAIIKSQAGLNSYKIGVKEFEWLRLEEQKQISWNAKRGLSKINYRIHIDEIKQNLVSAELTKEQINYIYAEETVYI